MKNCVLYALREKRRDVTANCNQNRQSNAKNCSQNVQSQCADPRTRKRLTSAMPMQARIAHQLVRRKKPRLLFAPSPRALKDNNSGSDSEESGIYPLADTPQQKPFRSRTNALAEKPKISTGSRILALLLRREILKNQQKDQPEEIVRIKKAASNLNVSKEHEEHDFHEFIKQKYKRFALRYIRKMKKHVVVEEEPEKPSDLEMLDKALRYMTL
uniref:Uncharacterized protein n=1 Tax=Bactrocera latifrons TaxID=174628 RepID=A0A0K8UJU0_BACLA